MAGFGELHKIVNQIQTQERQILAAKSLIHAARYETVNGESTQGNILRLLSDALKILDDVSA